MAENSDLLQLYSKRILALSADMPFTDRLMHPDASVKKRAPVCGSTVTVELCIHDGLVSAFGQDVKACALGQASAAVLGAAVIGRNRDELQNARDSLYKMLKENGPVPSAPFNDLEALSPARDYKNRHASVMLVFDAVTEAMEIALNRS